MQFIRIRVKINDSIKFVYEDFVPIILILQIPSVAIRYPVMSSIDPYGDTTFIKSEISKLTEEMLNFIKEEPVENSIKNTIVSLVDIFSGVDLIEFLGD